MIAEILSGSNNFYRVKIPYDKSRIALEIGRLEKLIIELSERDDSFSRARIISCQKKKTYLQSQPDYKYVTAWNPTYEEAAKSGTVNVSPIPNNSQTVYQICDDNGKLAKPINNKPTAAYLNQVLKYWWEQWKPTYRHGTITRKTSDSICDVIFSPPIKNTVVSASNVNITNCGGLNYEPGDNVLIKFDGNPETPSVIGFKSNPKECDFSCTEDMCNDFDVYDGNIQYIIKGMSSLVYVTGGCPPYKWSVTGKGWSIAGVEGTQEPMTVVTGGCGTGKITCTSDECGKSVSFSIASDEGFWEFLPFCESLAECPGRYTLSYETVDEGLPTQKTYSIYTLLDNIPQGTCTHAYTYEQLTASPGWTGYANCNNNVWTGLQYWKRFNDSRLNGLGLFTQTGVVVTGLPNSYGSHTQAFETSLNLVGPILEQQLWSAFEDC